MTSAEIPSHPTKGDASTLSAKAKTEIYRTAAMNRLASPERLDLGARVVRPASWLILFALVFVIIGAAAAAVFIKVPIKAAARGMLLSPEGLKEVVATNGGQIRSLHVKPGDFVHAGEDVAFIAQPDAGQELMAARAAERDAQTEADRVGTFQTASVASLANIRNAQRQDLVTNMTFSTQRIKLLEDREKGQQLLLSHGFLAKDRLLETYVEIGTARVERAKLETQLKQLDAEALSEKIQRDRELLSLQFKLGDAKRQVVNVEEKLNRLVAVKSPYTGVVAELKMNEGEVVGNGTPIFSVFPEEAKAKGATGAPLIAAIYVPQSEGKRVHPGMTVQIVPSTIKREEYGFITGTVTSVAELPSTSEGMMRMLKNQQLVQSLALEGAPFQVTASIEISDKTPSGYRWSSSKGPPTQISHATPCDAEIVIKKVSLLSLVMPSMHKFLGDTD